jgi:hypothetical protein
VVSSEAENKRPRHGKPTGYREQRPLFRSSMKTSNSMTTMSLRSKNGARILSSCLSFATCTPIMNFLITFRSTIVQGFMRKGPSQRHREFTDSKMFKLLTVGSEVQTGCRFRSNLEQFSTQRDAIAVTNRIRRRLRGAQRTSMYRNLVHCRLFMSAKLRRKLCDWFYPERARALTLRP